MLTSRILCVLGLLLYSAMVSAASLAPIVVSDVHDSRTTIADVNLETYNGFEQTIAREEFEHYLTDVADILDLSISAQIRKTSGSGSFSAASIRGSSGRQINLYLDGMLLSNPQNGSSSLSVIPVSIIEQIEIYPDFTPAQFGDANLGGAINIRTRAPRQGMGGRAALSFASFNTQQLDVDWWAGNAQTEMVLAASLSDSDNDYPIDRKACAELQMTCGSSRHRLSAAYDQQSVLAKVRHQFDDQYSLQVLASSAQIDSDVPSQTNRRSHQAYLEQTLHQFNVLLQADQQHSSWGVRVYSHLQEEHFTNPTAGSLILGGSDIEQDLSTLGFNTFGEYEIANHTFSGALDYSSAKNETQDLQQAIRLEATRKKWVLSLADYWQITSLFAMNANLRAHHLQDQSDAPATGMGSSAHCAATNKDCQNFEKSYLSWQAGFAITPENWVIKGNIGEMVRMPTLIERFGQTGAFLGTADLKHEQSENVDLGFTYQHPWAEIQLTLFHKTLTDGIFLLYDARGVAKPANISEAVIHGAEGLITVPLGQYVSVFTGGQWMDTENKSVIAADRGKKLQTIYHESLQAGITVAYQHHLWQLTYHLDKDMYFDPANRIKAPNRKRLDTRYTWFIDNFSVNVSINNLLDERYFDFNFMPAVGRHYSTTLTYHF